MDEEVLLGDVKEKLAGLKVGEKADVTLPDGNEHTLEVIGIRKATKKPEENQDQAEEAQPSVQ